MVFSVFIALVHKLILEQFPDWAALPLKPVLSSGTDNALYQVGDTI
ncbi:MAG: hypothetical protein WCG10_02455 [Chlamydiota bacterium]